MLIRRYLRKEYSESWECMIPRLQKITLADQSIMAAQSSTSLKLLETIVPWCSSGFIGAFNWSFIWFRETPVAWTAVHLIAIVSFFSSLAWHIIVTKFYRRTSWMCSRSSYVSIWCIHLKKWVSDSFKIEWNMIVLTISLFFWNHIDSIWFQNKNKIARMIMIFHWIWKVSNTYEFSFVAVCSWLDISL